MVANVSNVISVVPSTCACGVSVTVKLNSAIPTVAIVSSRKNLLCVHLSQANLLGSVTELLANNFVNRNWTRMT